MKATNDTSEQVAGTYRALRFALAGVSFAFPLLLWVGGYVIGHVSLAGSMSAYYHASDPVNPYGGAPGAGIMRNEFVGILFGVGALLFAYQGYSRWEDYALNLAAILAFAIALFPMAWPPDSSRSSFSVHGTCAIAFFISIAYVCIWRAGDTLSLIESERRRRRYAITYRLLGIAMVAFPLAAWVLLSALPFRRYVIFFVEVAGIYVFATYWLVKSIEAIKTDLDRQAARGNLQIARHTFRDVLRPVPVQRLR